MNSRPLRILLIGDDRALLHEGAQWLAALGCEVMTASGRAQLGAIGAGEPLDVIIVDGCAAEGALELCRYLGGLPATRLATLLLATDSERRDAVEQALAAGVDDFLAHPFRAGEWPPRIHAAARLTELRHRLQMHFGRDAATGLPNGAAWNDAVAERMAGPAPRGGIFAIAAFDHLAPLERAWGRGVIETELAAAARRIRDALPESIELFRLERNRLGLIGEPQLDVASIQAVARESLARGKERELGATVSIGWLVAAGTVEPQQVRAALETSLLQAQQRGGDIAVQARLGTTPASPISLLHLLQRARAVDLMTPCALELTVDSPLETARGLLLETGLAAVIVVDSRGELAGILERETIPDWPAAEGLTAADCMDRVVALAEDTPFPDVMESFTQQGSAVAVVLRDRRPIGLIHSESLTNLTEPPVGGLPLDLNATTRPGRYVCVPDLASVSECPM